VFGDYCAISKSPYSDPTQKPSVESTLAVADELLRANFLGAYSWVLSESWASAHKSRFKGNFSADYIQYTSPAW
jgi:hypothetical protein